MHAEHAGRLSFILAVPRTTSEQFVGLSPECTISKQFIALTKLQLNL